MGYDQGFQLAYNVGVFDILAVSFKNIFFAFFHFGHSIDKIVDGRIVVHV